ncbi:MDR/zinc-dependent alcohol dehydrogenase-like family protein [Aspergillus melleus]|uniref:MDR/zinc-dependent alcohol dehydrogenase-like family protein n=1 Tax=Aspergillus melleus TaxID=138277 RepID=UPI001E8ED05E|nr:uncharacterized protein LDX57_002140 [Aspergillus melleus]KAH8424389.1 hypothetical protein LDX57_002140 [Aspergillus melleus]
MTTKYVTISQTPGLPGKVYYPLVLRSAPIPPLHGNSLLIKISAAALNHRDHFLRQHLYPGTTFGVPLLADGAGIVVDIGTDVSPDWLNRRVIIYPSMGWSSSPYGPEEGGYVRVMGGTRYNARGTLTEYMVIEQDGVELVPPHLSDVEAAALPVTGLTAWRALMTKAGEGMCGPGSQILITGIGGGVALMALLFAVHMGADVWVTSSSREKLDMTMRLGAKGGVNYTKEHWEDRLLDLLPERREFDAVIDGAGGDIVHRAVTLLKAGGRVVTYGMTRAPSLSVPMRVILKNLDICGKALGSRREFAQMVDFVRKKRIVPVISRVVNGIENLHEIEELFDMLRSGSQLGKLVIKLNSEEQCRL